MLRGCAEVSEYMLRCLEDFGIPRGANLLVKDYEALTPDSFRWILLIDGEGYILYAEDFIESIEQVINGVTHDLPELKGNLVRTVHETAFDDLDAVRSAAVYREPDEYASKIKPYATSSGYDVVFLYKVSTDNAA